ncbi:MAG TPA: DivIVA domain-containing protein [Acidimicrobiia bacterium]|nr:DivIVA domain-containing protein [Acidimicrobiia bacterium]
MEITPRELRDIEIREAFRGYHRDDVNDLLERAAETIDALTERMRQMSERLGSASTDAGRSRETEDILHRTLLLAQRAADDAIAEAQTKARQTIDDADNHARRVLAEAEGEARRRGESERRRMEQEIIDLAARREVLLADVEALSRYENDYRDRVVRALEADLEAWRNRPTLQPGPRPEVADVALPVAPEGVARRDPDPRDEPRTQQIDVHALFAAQQATAAIGESGDAPTSASPRGADSGAVQARAESAPTGARAEGVAREHGVAVATSEPESTPPDAAIDLAHDDAVEAHVMDDDAFFASLRDAVRDSDPLGPRDEGDVPFFDQDDDPDRANFREMFRRRR